LGFSNIRQILLEINQILIPLLMKLDDCHFAFKDFIFSFAFNMHFFYKIYSKIPGGENAK